MQLERVDFEQRRADFFFHKAQFLLGSKTTNLMHKEQATIYQL